MAAIRTIVLKDGSKRYRFTVDTGRDPVTDKRRQTTMTFTKLKDASAELARIGHQSRTGEYVARSRETVDQICDAYLSSASDGAEAATESCYRHALKPARERLGKRLAQSIDRGDIEQLRDWMRTAGRKRGGTPGTGLGERSVKLTLGRLSAAFEQACDSGKLYRNPCRPVLLDLAKKQKKKQGNKAVKRNPKSSWTEDEARQFLAEAAGDRLDAAWRMTLYGARREEVCGARWEQDIDLEAATWTVNIVRVVVDGKVIVKDAPKSENGARTLPLDDDLLAALKALRKQQLMEQLAAGPAYEPGGYVVADELGAAVNPEWYSDEFHRVRTRAGVRRITLHEARHTAITLMEKAGVPISIISKWAGHATAEFTYRVYVHADQADLDTGRDALSQIYKIDNVM